MAQTTPPSVTVLPPAPSILAPTTFATLADAFIAALATFRTELNALAANVYANGTDIYNSTITSTSTTSLSIAIASKTFTIQSGKQYASGQFVTASSNAVPANYMHGQITSYSGSTLIVNVLDVGGSGTYADWNISISGTQGPLNTNVELLANKDATGGYAGLTLFKINFKNAANTFTSFFTNINTASRTYTAQDKSGTLAHTDDIPSANDFINGNMLVAQHGTSQALTASFVRGSIDMWAFMMATSAAGTASQVASGITGIKYAAKMQRTNGSALTNPLFMQTAMESIDSIPYAGKTVTVSFYAKAGANYSASGNILNFSLYTNAISEQACSGSASGIGSWTGAIEVATIAQAITTSFVRYSFTGTIGSTIVQLGLQSYFTPTGTAGADDSVYITGVQIDDGTVALPLRQKSFTSSQRRCQRWFEKSFNYAVAPANAVGANTSGEVKTQAIKAGAVTAVCFHNIKYKAPKRAPGVVTIYNPVNNNSEVHDFSISADCSSSFASSPQENGVTIAATGNASTVQGNVLFFHWSVDSGL